MIEQIEQALETTAGNLAFGAIVLVIVGVLLLGLLFFGVALRAAWSWLCRLTWNRVVLSAERKATRKI